MLPLLRRLAALFREGFRHAKARYGQTTPRERLLLGLLALAAPLLAATAALEWRNRQQSLYADVFLVREAAKRERAATRRAVAAASNVSGLEDMKTWGVVATNDAIAQVLVEDSLNRAITLAGLGRPDVRVDSGTDAIGPTRWITAEVQADLSWTSLFAFVDDLAEWPEGFRVTSFHYELTATDLLARSARRQEADEPAPPAGRVRLGLAFPLRQDVELADGRAESSLPRSASPSS